MNYRVMGGLSSGTAGATPIFFIAHFMDMGGATLEAAVLMLLTSIIGFGVTRYYQVTESMIVTSSNGTFDQTE